MTRRLTLFLVFLLLAGLLAPASQVKASTVSYYGLYLNGVNAYVDAGNSSTLNPQSITVVALFKLSSLPPSGGRYYIVDKTNQYRFFVDSSGHIYWQLNLNGTWAANWIISTSTIQVGESVLVATTYDPNTGEAKIFLNGKLDASGSPPTVGQITVTTNPAWIGYKDDKNYTHGDVYEVLIYNRALSDSEIQQIYADPLHPPTSGLVLWYAPDSVDTANGLWLDKSGNGNDGSIVGATYVPLRPLSESEPSAENPYELDFNESGYIQVNSDVHLSNVSQFSIVAIVQPKPPDVHNPIFNAYGGAYSGIWFVLQLGRYLRLRIGNGTTIWDNGGIDVGFNNSVFVAAVFDKGDVALYRNLDKFTFTASFQEIGTISTTYIGRAIGWYGNNPFNGNFYVLYVYARALSDEEIRQIYEHPNNPPLDGLVLWYSPYTYDPASGKWLNRAPIFPTIPLCEELDGVNYGATPERVSIPSASYYDIENNSEIPVENVSVSMLANNTTISLIPSFLTLPWNQTVALNVSATGYESRTLSILTTINSLAVYLQPLQSNTTTNPIQPPTETISPLFKISDNYNDQGLWGGRLGIYFLTGNWSEGFRRFWTLNPMFELVLPVIFAFGIILSSYLVTRKPLVPVGTTAVMATFFGMLGIPLQLSIATPLAALFIFWIVYILWGFYKRFERS